MFTTAQRNRIRGAAQSEASKIIAAEIAALEATNEPVPLVSVRPEMPELHSTKRSRWLALYDALQAALKEQRCASCNEPLKRVPNARDFGYALIPCECSARAPRWIPCSERLPKLGQLVLVARTGDLQVILGKCSMIGAELTWDHVNRRGELEGLSGRWITHWMPLPEPPKRTS